MATIKPFRAIRPTRDKAALATSRSYDEYSKKELRAVLTYNPYSFLHIIKPGYINDQKLTGDQRFHSVNHAFKAFKNENIYCKDDKPQFYLHKKSYGSDVFWGIIAVAHVKDYQNNIIRKHEDTLKEREELFGNYLGIAGFNAEPVLLAYPENDVLNSIYQKYSGLRAEYEFMTHTKRLHKLWIIADETDIECIEKEFKKMNSMYIADGHHRTASSNYLANKKKKANRNHTGKEPYNYFMCYLIADTNLKISSFNRFVKDLNGLTKAAFLEKLRELYFVEKCGDNIIETNGIHHFTMYLEGEYYSLLLKDNIITSDDTLSNLDTLVIQRTILNPILGITDLKTDPRIKCLPAVYNKKQLQREVDSGNFKVGFGLFPISTAQLKTVADENLRMPPKSTYIEPKLRSGLIIFEL